MLICNLVAAFLLLTASISAAEPYSFRTYKLGMSIAEFRKLPHPDPENYKDYTPFVVCSGDPKQAEIDFKLTASDREKKVGIIRCKYFTVDLPGQFFSEPVEAGIITANIGTYVTFQFLQTTDTYRLFEIDIESTSDNFDHFASVYTERFGTPSRANRPVQNTLGATFEDSLLVWSNGESFIAIQQRWNQIDNMRIQYLHTQLNMEANKRFEAVFGKPSDKL